MRTASPPTRSYLSSRRFQLVVVVALALLLGAVGMGIHTALATTAQPGPLLPTGRANHGPLGIPAIQPRANLAQGTGPHFTADDVRQYVMTHRPPFSVPGTSYPVVDSVQFLTASEASAQLQGESIGVPDSTLVCLVRLSGTFRSTYGPPGMPPTQSFTQGVMVFDAHTGNLLTSNVG